MYPVTQEFQDKVLAQKRKIIGKVKINFTDPMIDQSVEVVTSENNHTSYPQQVTDGYKKSTAATIALDGTWELGNEHVLAPSPSELRVFQMGWRGSQLSDANGDFAEPYPTLVVEFYARPILDLVVIGEKHKGEYPVDFDIYVYDESNTVLYHEEVTDNTEVEWEKKLQEQILGATKLELVIKKWSHPGRTAKIIELISIIIEEYEADEVFLINLLEERDASSGSLPVGNIASNEIKIKLNNKYKQFDLDNEDSNIFGLIRANRRITPYLGVPLENGEVEYVPLGVFWSGDWDIPEGKLYAETTGRDLLDMLGKSTYDRNEILENVTLAEIAEDVFDNAGFSPDLYEIDANLSNYIIPYAYFSQQSHRNVLRTIVEAVGGVVYCDRQGKIRVQGAASAGEQVGEITKENYFTLNNPLKWSEIANQIEVTFSPKNLSEEKVVYETDEPLQLQAGENEIFISFNESPCTNTNIEIISSPTDLEIRKQKYTATGAEFIFYVPNNSAIEFKINGKVLEDKAKEIVITKDEASILDNGLMVYRLENNLIQTRAAATNIANMLLSIYKNPRRDITLDWRGNPSLILGDIIEVEGKKYHIYKQELEYNGTLRSKLEGRITK